MNWNIFTPLLGGIVVVFGAIFIILLIERGDDEAGARLQDIASTTEMVLGTPKQTNTATGGSPVAPRKELTSDKPYNYLVTYTQSGFAPKVLEINDGESVRFINSANSPMWIQAITENNSNNHSELNQGRSSSRGGYYDFTFNGKGIWLYQNLNDRTKTGVVHVR